MKNFTTMLTAASLAIAGGVGIAQAATVDTVEFATDFFVPSSAETYDDPYYRWWDDDWGWTHNAIAAGFTSAELSISAFDVDFDDGEVDNIYAFKGGIKTLLGSLSGASDVYSFTTFTLDGSWFADITLGLQVFMDIDALNPGPYDSWAVALAKSVITTDGAGLPDPDPGPSPVPLPAAGWLLLAGLGGLAGLRRRRSAT